MNKNWTLIGVYANVNSWYYCYRKVGGLIAMVVQTNGAKSWLTVKFEGPTLNDARMLQYYAAKPVANDPNASMMLENGLRYAAMALRT